MNISTNSNYWNDIRMYAGSVGIEEYIVMICRYTNHVSIQIHTIITIYMNGVIKTCMYGYGKSDTTFHICVQ